ncbi:MAG: helix-turn-helix domain-containing protein [Clostridia bacterium]|nr:helix-turn-helix domain-containing protein [Clostridia bacterium]
MDLSGGEILVYSYLLYCEDRETFTCYPSLSKIGKGVGMSKNTVLKYVRRLEEKGLIETENTTVITRRGEKHNGTLKYLIKPITAAENKFDERQMKELIAESRKAEVQKAIRGFDENHTQKSGEKSRSIFVQDKELGRNSPAEPKNTDRQRRSGITVSSEIDVVIRNPAQKQEKASN